MTPFFAYLVKTSISLALLYILFRFVLRNDGNHMLNRFLLLGILVISSIIPCLDIQFFYEEVPLQPVELFKEFVTLPLLADSVAITETTEVVQETPGTPVNYWLILYLCGGGFLVFRLLLGVYRVIQIIRNAEKRWFENIVLAVVKELIHPFTFLNRIIISRKDFAENQDIVVAHEHAHIKHLHAMDLMVCELFTILHFFNPFMWLLRRDLKLIHEYQADQAVLNKGIDAQKYQLLVLEKAVGKRRFAMANHFTQKPILKRLKMMKTTNKNRWGAVKLILFVPLIALLLQAFARPELITNTNDFIPVKYTENKIEKWLSKWNPEKIGRGFYQPELKKEEVPKEENNVLVILMNAKDQFLVENQYAKKEGIKQIVKNYLLGINPDGKKGPDYVEKEIPFVGKIKTNRGIISYKHDVASSKEMVYFTLRAIGEACLEVKNDKAKILFDKEYFDLEEEKQKAVDMAVPIWFSYELPKAPAANVWLPFERKASPDPKPFDILIKSPGEIYVKNYKFTSLEAFKEGIKAWHQELEPDNTGRRGPGKFYTANLTIEYMMPEEVWQKLRYALHRSEIHIRKISKPLGVRVVTWSERKKEMTMPIFADSIPREIRDTGVLYLTLFNDEEVDLSEIKKLAKKCIDTKKVARLEIEKGVSDKDIIAVKKVLNKCGISKIEQVTVEDQTNHNSGDNLASIKADVLSNQEGKTHETTKEKKIPFVRFHDSWIMVNRRNCELATLKSTLEEVLAEDPNQRKVEMVIYPTVSKTRVNKIYAELSSVKNLEIIKNNFVPAPRPPKTPELILHLFSDKIIYSGKFTHYGGKIISMEEVTPFTEQWIKEAGNKFKKSIVVHNTVSEERIDQVKTAMINGGAI